MSNKKTVTLRLGAGKVSIGAILRDGVSILQFREMGEAFPIGENVSDVEADGITVEVIIPTVTGAYLVELATRKILRFHEGHR